MNVLCQCNVCNKTYQTHDSAEIMQCPHCGNIGARIIQRLYAFLGI